MTLALIIVAASVFSTILGFIAMACLRKLLRWVRSPRSFPAYENEMLGPDWENKR